MVELSFTAWRSWFILVPIWHSEMDLSSNRTYRKPALTRNFRKLAKAVSSIFKENPLSLFLQSKSTLFLVPQIIFIYLSLSLLLGRTNIPFFQMMRNWSKKSLTSHNHFALWRFNHRYCHLLLLTIFDFFLCLIISALFVWNHWGYSDQRISGSGVSKIEEKKWIFGRWGSLAFFVLLLYLQLGL